LNTAGAARAAAMAARNNAAWCHAVCSAHGALPRFEDTLWVNPTRRSPPYYPNLITLDPAADSATVANELDALARRDGCAGFGVKDSFDRLDLSARGFVPLFEAAWVLKPASPRAGPALRSRLRWSLAGDAAALAAWETAWWAHSVGQAAPGQALFPPALRAAVGVGFLLGCEPATDTPIAGCALMDAAGCIGLACAFVAAAADAPALAREQLAAVQHLHPALPVVGYEQGAALAQAVALGFEPCGPLRVWVQAAAASAAR
jgi:hypothetical protein